MVTPSKRPAEFAGAGAAAGVLFGRALGVTDPDTLAALGVLAGCVPAAVTSGVVYFERRRARPKVG